MGLQNLITTGSGARLLPGGSLARKVITPTAEASDLRGSHHGIRFTDKAFDDLATIQGGAADSEASRQTDSAARADTRTKGGRMSAAAAQPDGGVFG